MQFNSIGDRMKRYESTFLHQVNHRSYTILRIDGRAFHTYTRGLQKPFDEGLIDDMNATALYLCSKIQGAKLGYVQSDEISIIITDFDDHATQSWFDNEIQKMVSISASMATAKFNRMRYIRFNDVENIKLAEFDSRVFQIPVQYEVFNYLLWRQQDASRNSIQMVARNFYSDSECFKKSTNELQEMIFQKGINWNEYSDHLKRGRCIIKADTENGLRWTLSEETPIFNQNWDWLKNYIPDIAM